MDYAQTAPSVVHGDALVPLTGNHHRPVSVRPKEVTTTSREMIIIIIPFFFFFFFFFRCAWYGIRDSLENYHFSSKPTFSKKVCVCANLADQTRVRGNSECRPPYAEDKGIFRSVRRISSPSFYFFFFFLLPN